MNGAHSFFIAFDGNDLGLRMQGHVRQRRDAIDEIFRHAFRQISPANQVMYMRRVTRQEYYGLPAELPPPTSTTSSRGIARPQSAKPSNEYRDLRIYPVRVWWDAGILHLWR